MAVHGAADCKEALLAPVDCSNDALARDLATDDPLDARAVVIKARDFGTTFGLKISNADVAAFCREHSPRFIGFAGVDPHKGDDRGARVRACGAEASTRC